MTKVIPHWEFIPDEVIAGTHFDKKPIKVDFTGVLAQAIRDEAMETGKHDIEVIHGYLVDYLADRNLPRKVPVNCLPIRAQVGGTLAAHLRKNAAARGISPEDSAIEILSEVFDIPRPQARKREKQKPVPKGLAFTVEVPGIVAQAIRRSNYPKPISSDLIVGILLDYFPDPNGQPVIPGMEVCV